MNTADTLNQRSFELMQALIQAAKDPTFSPSRGWAAFCLWIECNEALTSGSYQEEALKKLNVMREQAKARAA